jgi:predicted RNase H-like nuclease
MVPERGMVLGVDVGWSAKKKTTGAAVLSWTPAEAALTVVRLPTEDDARREGLVSLVGNRRILALAVDGPVRGALDEIGVYRDAELILTRGLAAYIGKPAQTSSGNGKKLNVAANAIVRSVLETGRLAVATHDARIHERAIVEAFPTTFVGVMLDDGCIPSHGARSDAYFLHLLGPNADAPRLPKTDRLIGLLGRLLPGRRLTTEHLGAVQHHEERAAVICALTALCVAARNYVAIGDPNNGYIVLPPKASEGEPGLQPWAWAIIDGNRPANASRPIIVEPAIPLAMEVLDGPS